MEQSLPVTSRNPRLLIFVIAYCAESTLVAVLDRIPGSIFEQYDCEVLVVDDGSADRTFAIGREYRALHPEMRVTVLRNEYNQGYGGNQKVGYAFAIEEGFDFVAMLHGDGQYAPEELPRLVGPLASGDADAVFGSRMMKPFEALRGGMPLYKYVGNKVLTRAQNFMLGTRLSEFHSGYRIYSVKSLKQIPFRLNSNDFHFDTEIIIQLFNAGARVHELPVPTFYGDEICRVNGMKYAKDVLVATLKNVAHRSGLLYQRRFDPHLDEVTEYDLKVGYQSSHSYAIAAVPRGGRVLDVGSCVPGVANELAKKGCEVTAVQQHPLPVDSPRVRVVVQDLNDELVVDVKSHEHILLLDVIEHLRDPERFIERLRAQFGYDPKTVIITTPNIAFVVQRIMLLLGQFNYGRVGVLDRTHSRLFTFRAIENILRDSGFKIKEIKGVPAPLPKVFGNGIWGRTAMSVNLALIALSKTLFSYQIYVEATSTPDISFLLRDAKEKSELSAADLPFALDVKSNPALMS